MRNRSGCPGALAAGKPCTLWHFQLGSGTKVLQSQLCASAPARCVSQQARDGALAEARLERFSITSNKRQAPHLCVGGDVLEAAAQDAERLLRAETLRIREIRTVGAVCIRAAGLHQERMSLLSQRLQLQVLRPHLDLI